MADAPGRIVMTAIFFLLELASVLWLGFWSFAEPTERNASKPPRATPFDYVDHAPEPGGETPTASGARWRQRRAQTGKRP
jgi:hypothetical protein